MQRQQSNQWKREAIDLVMMMIIMMMMMTIMMIIIYLKGMLIVNGIGHNLTPLNGIVAVYSA